MIRVVSVSLVLAAVAVAEEAKPSQLTPYSVTEIDQYLASFKASFKKKSVPEEDAVAMLSDFEKAYRYLESKGDARTKVEEKAQANIVKMISRGLKARGRATVIAECARSLGRLADARANKDLLKWMGRTLDAKEANPLWIEYGFLALARIGSQDTRTLDLILKQAVTGKDSTVQGHAYRAAYEFRLLKGKVRKEWFKKMLGRVGGLYNQYKNGDPKSRGTYEKRYNEIKQYALTALNELSGANENWQDPTKAGDWFKANKRRKWNDYVGVNFRKKEAAKPKGDKDKKDDKGDAEKEKSDKGDAEEDKKDDKDKGGDSPGK